jgi:FlaA1/EpsC-like NDP-sugar epimerase
MTIPEAVQLVIYAAAIGRPGEVLVLDMGSPVRIADVARQLMHIAGRSTEIVYTGLGAGEKLHEELFGEREIDSRPIHPLISHVSVPSLHPAQLADRAMKIGVAEAMADFTATTTDAEVSMNAQSTTMIPRESDSAYAV